VTESSQPIFVLGAPRSGTSMLAWALAQHPAFWTSGESLFIYDLFGEGQLAMAFDRTTGRSGESFLTLAEVSKSELCAYIGRGIDALYLSRSGGRRWIDHTPHYALMVNTLADMFPGGKVLHILRDGRRVVHSMLHFLDRLPSETREATIEAGLAPPWATDFTTACETWATYVAELKRFERASPDRCMTVENERLVEDPHGEFARILGFLEVEGNPAPAEYFSTHRFNSSFQPDPDKKMTTGDLTEPWQEWSDERVRIFEDVRLQLPPSVGIN
jgi:hypothetical protein